MMDAVEFLKERSRMCNAQGECDTCPITTVCEDYFLNHNYNQENAEGMVATVEQWAKEHPVKTRQSEFLKLFPGAEPTKDGVLAICPNAFSPVYKDERGLCKWHYAECDNCCRKFWLAEVEK